MASEHALTRSPRSMGRWNPEHSWPSSVKKDDGEGLSARRTAQARAMDGWDFQRYLAAGPPPTPRAVAGQAPNGGGAVAMARD